MAQHQKIELSLSSDETILMEHIQRQVCQSSPMIQANMYIYGMLLSDLLQYLFPIQVRTMMLTRVALLLTML